MNRTDNNICSLFKTFRVFVFTYGSYNLRKMSPETSHQQRSGTWNWETSAKTVVGKTTAHKLDLAKCSASRTSTQLITQATHNTISHTKQNKTVRTVSQMAFFYASQQRRKSQETRCRVNPSYTDQSYLSRTVHGYLSYTVQS
jgi:electron transfer flavoprotein alpha subunit